MCTCQSRGTSIFIHTRTKKNIFRWYLDCHLVYFSFLLNFIFCWERPLNSWLKTGITRGCLIIDNWRGWALPPPKISSQKVSSTGEGEDWVLVGWLDNGPCMFWIQPLMWHRVQGCPHVGAGICCSPVRAAAEFFCFHRVWRVGLKVLEGVDKSPSRQVVSS